MSRASDRSSLRRRIWSDLPAGGEHPLRDGLSPTDLQSLLLDIVGSRAARVTPARLMQRWREDRFVQPSSTDPRVLAAVEAQLWELLPRQFVAVELSPLSPLGTCSVITASSQDRVVTTVRGSEVVSDPTNVLAIEAAARRRHQERAGRVDIAAAQRVVRAQVFDGPGLFSHFKLFALVSSGRDRGAGRTEAGMIVDHLTFYATALRALLSEAQIVMTVSTFIPGAIDERLREALPALSAVARNVTVQCDTTRTQGRGYYTSHAIKIDVIKDDRVANLGDGGLTAWTSVLTTDAKERCLTSCISTERLAGLCDGGDHFSPR